MTRHFDDLDLAFWLTHSVGRSIGLRFSQAIEEGRLEPARFAALIDVCRACPHSGACQEWLGKAGGPRGAEAAPDFCPNGPAMRALKKH